MAVVWVTGWPLRNLQAFNLARHIERYRDLPCGSACRMARLACYALLATDLNRAERACPD